jgi:hypothetical protein
MSQLISRRAILPHPAMVSAMCSQNPACTASSHTRSNAAIFFCFLFFVFFFFFFTFYFCPCGSHALRLYGLSIAANHSWGIFLGLLAAGSASFVLTLSTAKQSVCSVHSISVHYQSRIHYPGTGAELEQNRQKGVRRASTTIFTISRAIPESSDQLSERLPRWM